MALLGEVLLWAVQIYFLVLLARAAISWILMLAPGFRPRGPLLVLFEVIYSLTDPPLRWLHRWVKPVRLGTLSLDLAFIVLWVALLVLQRVIWMFFF
ncbi:MAG: YggT family protein [Actinomycetia bacterium]|nr:YggT family protein [Actinomycetes bacterium]